MQMLTSKKKKIYIYIYSGQRCSNYQHLLINIITSKSTITLILKCLYYMFTHFSKTRHQNAIGSVSAWRPLCAYQERDSCAIVCSDRLNEGECFSVLRCVRDTCWAGLHRPALLCHYNMQRWGLFCSAGAVQGNMFQVSQVSIFIRFRM